MNDENEAHMEPEVRPEPLYASFVAIRNTELTVYWARELAPFDWTEIRVG